MINSKSLQKFHESIRDFGEDNDEVFNVYWHICPRHKKYREDRKPYLGNTTHLLKESHNENEFYR